MEHVERLRVIRARLHTGELEYREARRLAEPHIRAFNAVSREKAKKHGVRPKLMTFAGFMR
ncbi:MAG: hypothetical protein WD492_12860 [Alkalispirochaeta sp.]